MFAVPGILVLIGFIYVRPQEFIPILQSVPLLYLFFALAIFGFVVDLKLRKIRPQLTPQFGWVMLFLFWCLFTLAIRSPDKLPKEGVELIIPIVLFVVIAHGVQTFRMFQLIAGLLLALTLFLAFVGVHQHFGPFGCFVLEAGSEQVGVYDGRLCESHLDRECAAGDPEPGADYICEQVGLFGTSSIGKGRVRYLGPLQDPNELALAIGVAAPFAFGFLERKRTSGRIALLATTLVLVGMCTVYTQSRGGQLVFLAAVGAYFIRRYGWRGALLGAICGAPLLLLGGRSGTEADASAMERLECWYEGMTMWREHPLIGVGALQFTDYHFLTAHNSYVLAPAEIGLIGFVIWTTVLWVSLKIPITALARLSASRDPAADVARTWAMALIASLIGMLVGIFFLSFCYHQVLWIYLGLCGAYYSALRTHDPGWTVEIKFADIAIVIGIDLIMIALLFVYTRLKV
jgi:O-antigen ligase